MLTPLLLILLAAAPVDWLVTRDGDRIETRSGWRVDGQRVLFQRPNGTLTALRLSEVDLEASRAANEPAASRTSSENDENDVTSGTGPETLVLTTNDIPSAIRPVPPSEPEAGPAAPPSGLHVSEWQDITAAGDAGVRIEGRVMQGPSDPAGPLEVMVTLMDELGAPVASQATAATERRGWPRTFRVLFPGAYVYDRVEFEVAPPAVAPSSARLRELEQAAKAMPQPERPRADVAQPAPPSTTVTPPPSPPLF